MFTERLTAPPSADKRKEFCIMLRKSFVCIGMWMILVAALAVPQSLSMPCTPPPSGMVAWWSLDETTGPTAHDIAGSANNSGTWMNSPTPVTGKVAGALSFSGSNSVDVPNQAELNFGTGDFSIDFWIKTTASSGTHPILDKRTGSVPNLTGYQLYVWNGKPGLQLADGAGYTVLSSTGLVADGNWHHVAVTVDRDNTSGVLFYVDGSLVSTLNPTARQLTLTNTAPFVMARNLISPSETFAGTLDELELFNRALDSLEVRSIWAADSAGKCKTTVCYADGDANNDGVGLTTADTTYLAGFINGCGPAPIPLYSCDLNGDGYVDPADLQLYRLYFWFGISVFDDYGGYPVLCPCNPDPAPVPDTVNIFGIEHVSGGTACFDTAGGVLTVSRIFENPCDTLVDANGDTIIVVAVSHPYKGLSGGGPFGSSKSNLEDAGIIVIEQEAEDTVTWSWQSQGVSGLQIDALRIEGKTDDLAKVGYLTSVVQY
ncbi:hypothetical protein MUP01_05835, partial [Candidatus Bathyarchaeota archaeon]|nr:hypothetical protein [Candidatus Bathyarchaeota archaeon]